MGLNVDLLRTSFELVVEREPEVTRRFYANLFRDFPQLKPLFSPARQSQQEQMLAQALAAVIEHLEDGAWLQQTLHALGARHVGYGVTDEMYDWVGAALLETLAQVAGDAWNDDLAQAWGDAYGAIAGLMQAGAAQADAAE